jgi:ArsR family transcriptional regulator, virulence genes transcriptional regulator
MNNKYNIELYKLKAELCKTFSDPKRLMIIDELRNGEKSVGDIAQSINLYQAAVSRELSILRDRGVVKPRREGTSIYYSLTNPKICEACDLVRDILLQQIEINSKHSEKLIINSKVGE